MKTASQEKFTIWTASASPDVPLLDKLDMRAPLTGVRSAKERAAKAKAKMKTMLAFYASRSSAESLRKLVK
ncbi:MAG: hypothetical protein E6J90_16150 [Deltaproteobacteria bacterium]|nr:MAG: hypothetical protein E6J91_51280 [Deltaproteobacteria bacterium]TMQ20425.1 MAG: hypothetical protein E6J90_16150 [Deltaproteobacteria bacterium]